MKKNKFGLLLLVLLLSLGCENLLIKDLELEEFDFEKVMAVSGEISNLTDTLQILVAENQSITSTYEDIVIVNNAEASLDFDNRLYSTFSGPLNDRYKSALAMPNPPGEYVLTVRNPSLGEVTAKTVIPDPVPIKDVLFTENAGIDPLEQVSTSSVRFTISDPPGEKNFYSFSVNADRNTMLFDTIYPEEGDTLIVPIELNVSNNVTDPNIEVVRSGEVLLSDATFDGKDYIIVLRFRVRGNQGKIWPVDNITEIVDKLHLTWKVISEDYYKFKTSFQDYQNSQFGLFSDPVGVFTNVENGLGVFYGSYIEEIPLR